MSGSGIVAPNQAPGAPRVQFVEDWFIYELDFLGVGFGTTVNGNFQVQADSDFKLIKLTAWADDTAGANVANPLCTLQINDSGSGRNLFSNPVPVRNTFGQGDLPFILPIPRIFKARSNVAVALQNFAGAGAYNIRLSFIGTKIFQLGQ